MENNEWPDAEKLKELRQDGIFPYSILTVECVTAVVFLAVTYFQFPNFEKMLELFRAIQSEPVSNFAAAKSKSLELMSLCGTVLIVYAVSFILSFLIIVSLQSKFYFSLVNLSFNLSHVLKVKNVSFMFFLNIIAKGLGGMLLGFAIGGALFYWISRQFLGIMFSDKLFGLKSLEAAALMPVIKSLLVISIFMLIVLSAVSYFFVRLSFLNKHRNNR